MREEGGGRREQGGGSREEGEGRREDGGGRRRDTGGGRREEGAERSGSDTTLEKPHNRTKVENNEKMIHVFYTSKYKKTLICVFIVFVC